MGLAAPQRVGSSWIRDRTRVPCIGRRILNHCATREVPKASRLLSLDPLHHRLLRVIKEVVYVGHLAEWQTLSTC